ncbi:MAG: ribbon-helix-helix domain-containing protein [Chloroflexi bacterium]|nr:ribbon-helix-helix domain-containing protein [Chloroflexota bacterium]
MTTCTEGMLYIALYMASTRTQIYLTEDQRDRLDELAEREGKSLAALIRAAVDEFPIRSAADPGKALDATFGSAPNFEVPSRSEWDRG